ncbi:hypothetical protein L861_01050 [Litchfieldella anticariensis FP35 = DSM 16096]|uniref:Positive regulator for alginate biosynthesis MucC n=1 Tax=Litchfieldella anticariensis (strain DSM 16096 / CECT 5854 / CIP 108499 / LMG 22089 / FP35) TaxID=1121939 RepID=S2LH09_LITA3|nr:SoxR reducing system RseC family protein [Halomonas anticariensis]EPC03916.1 hypothetical protein L861_01050 [Halomonas anticariensis FP35 = DSM 16096]
MIPDGISQSSYLIEEARVVQPYAGGALVEISRPSSCQRCEARQGCGSGLLARWRQGNAQRFNVNSAHPLQAGDRVYLSLPASRFLQGTLVVYGIPLGLALLAGGVTEMFLSAGHMAVPLTFALGLAVGWGIVQWHEHHHAASFRPRLLIRETSGLSSMEPPE